MLTPQALAHPCRLSQRDVDWNSLQAFSPKIKRRRLSQRDVDWNIAVNLSPMACIMSSLTERRGLKWFASVVPAARVLSSLTERRGLKLKGNYANDAALGVVSHRETWIEIGLACFWHKSNMRRLSQRDVDWNLWPKREFFDFVVVSHRETWIEIIARVGGKLIISVVSHRETWIEIVSG